MATSHSTQNPLPDSPDSELELEESGEIAISPEIAPDYSIPPTKLEQFKSSKWRAVAVFSGAILLGGILMPLIITSPQSSAQTEAVSTWELSLPQSSTMVTELSAAPGQSIRGKVSPVADITGKAPVGGAVARWVVEPGTRVQAGSPVVQISSGAASAPALPGETRQIEAEKQQTAAADDQVALAQRLTSTQQKLVMAQGRVERAQENIAKTREIIAGLRSGNTAQPDLPAPVIRRGKAKANPKLAEARAATKAAQADFNDTKAQLDNSRADLSSAQKALAPLQSKLDEAGANVKAIEAKFDGSLASASDVQAARSARDNAKSTLKSATTRLENAQKQIPTLEKQLAARERAWDAAKNAEAKVPPTVAGEEIEVEAPAPRAPANNASNGVSVEEATKMAKDALAESRAATREADKLRAQVDLYQAQAQKSNQRITSTTEKLQQEQQRSQSQMVQSVPRVRFTASRAPASGVVVWIATLAREVGAGQSVFGMSSGNSYQARFEDRTDGWKNARVGQVVNALLAPPAPVAPDVPQVTAPSANDAGSPPMPVLVSPGSATPPAKSAATPTPELTAENAAQLGAIPVKVRLTRIAPPEGGSAAILEGELVSAQGNGAGPDYRLLASLPSVGAPDILAVPETALVQRDGAWMVAVIENESASTGEPQTEVTPVPDSKAAPAEAKEPSGQLAWRVVEVGASNGVERRVTEGLKAGERIVTDPLPLIAQAPPEGTTMPRVKLSAL